MSLTGKFYKSIMLLTVFLISSFVYAYDYPVVGEYNANYEAVFKSIKEGKCDSMQQELDKLAAEEGVSPDIYLAICYYEKGDSEQAAKVFDKMLVAQDYDEVLYVSQTQMDKGNADSKLEKYRGLAYFNIGALTKSLSDLKSYLSKTMDEDVLFTIVDIDITLKNFADASEVLEKAPEKNGRYYYRKGRIALRTGKAVSALENLRKVTPESKRVYGSAKLLIGEICTSSKRFICAEKEYKLASATEEYGDTAKEKLDKLEEKKKFFTAFITLGEQYDTNVTSIDEDEIPGGSETSSFRTFAMADLKLNFYPAFADKVSVGTMNYKTWNHSLATYNMSTHSFYVAMRQGYDNFDVLLPKLTTSVTYFGGEKYSSAVSAEASGTYKQDSWTLGVPVKITRSNYENDEESGISSKDGFKYETSLEFSKKFMDIYTFKASGGYAKDDVKGDYKKKSDMTFKTSLSARLTPKIIPTASFSYANYDYDKIEREDDYYSYSLKTIYLLTPQMFLGGGLTWTVNDSDNNVYDYSKAVAEVSVSYSF